MTRGIVRPRLARRRGLIALGTVAAATITPVVVALGVIPASTASVRSPRTKRKGGGKSGHGASGEHPPPKKPDAVVSTPTWAARLLKAPRLQARLALLSDLGLSDSEIAQAFSDGTSARSVRRWRLHGMARDREPARWQPIDNLCALVGYLMSDGTFDEDTAIAWLRSRHPELSQDIPLKVLGRGRFDDVLDAAERSLGIVVGADNAPPGPISRAMATKATTTKRSTTKTADETGETDRASEQRGVRVL